MWIEEVIFKQYGNFNDKKLCFLEDKINIIIVDSEASKDKLAKSVYLVLYENKSDTDNFIKKPQNNNLGEIALIINLHEKHLKIIKDLHNSKIKVLEPPFDNENAKNLFANNSNLLNKVITGIDSEIIDLSFLYSLSYLDQKEQVTGLSEKIKGILNNIFIQSHKALELISSTDLYFEKDIKNLINDHKTKIAKCYEVQKTLDRKRNDNSSLIIELENINLDLDKFKTIDEQQNIFVYQNKLNNLNDLLKKLKIIQNEVKQHKFNWADIIVDNNILKIIEAEAEKLIIERNNSINDFNKLETELILTKNEFDKNINELQSKYTKYSSITDTDILEINNGLTNLKKLYNELNDLQKQNNPKAPNVSATYLKINDAVINDTKISIKTNEALLKAAQNELTILDQQEIQLNKELDKVKVSPISKFYLPIIITSSLISLGLIGSSLYQLLLNHQALQGIYLLLLAVGFTFAIITGILVVLKNKNKSSSQNVSDINSELNILQNNKAIIKNKISIINASQEKLTTTLNNIKTSKTNISVIGPMIHTKQVEIKNIIDKIATILNKNSVEYNELTYDFLEKLCSELNVFKSSRDIFNDSKESIDAGQNRRQNLIDSLNTTNQKIAQIFSQFNILNLNTFEESYEIYKSRLSTIHKWNEIIESEDISIQVTQIDDIDSVIDHTIAAINKIEDKITQINDKADKLLLPGLNKQELLQKFTNTANLINSNRKEIDEKFLNNQHELNFLTNKLISFITFDYSIYIAANKIKEVSKPDLKYWVNSINRELELIFERNTTFEQDFGISNIFIDADFSIFVTTKPDTTINLNDIAHKNILINKIDFIELLIRLSLFKLITNNQRIPMVIIDPFYNCDDESMLKYFEFLARNITNYNQIIIFSNDTSRYDWLKANISRRGRNKLHFSNLENI